MIMGSIDFDYKLTFSFMVRIFAMLLYSSVSKLSKLAGILFANSTREQRTKILKSNSESCSTRFIG